MGIQTFDAEIVAIICFKTIPNVPILNQDEWEHWLKELYYINVIGLSTLFIDYIGFKKEEEATFLKPCIFAMFFDFFTIEKILLLVPPSCCSFDWLEGNICKAKRLYSPSKVTSFRMLNRYDYSYNYLTRKAIEEDNDDIVPLIENVSKSFKELYGEFYISEIIRTPLHENRQILIAEYREKIVGVLLINRKLNYRIVNYNFDLECYKGLRTELEYEQMLGEPHEVPSVNIPQLVQSRDFYHGINVHTR